MRMTYILAVLKDMIYLLLDHFFFLFSILFPEEEEPAHPWIRDFKGKIENNMLMPK